MNSVNDETRANVEGFCDSAKEIPEDMQDTFLSLAKTFKSGVIAGIEMARGEINGIENHNRKVG